MAEKPVILVTGGAGYIGSHAVLALRDAGYGVAVIDNLTTGFRWAVPQDVAFVEGDIEDQALVEKLIADQDIKAIMHFAGSIIVPESVENPLKYYHNKNGRANVGTPVTNAQLVCRLLLETKNNKKRKKKRKGNTQKH